MRIACWNIPPLEALGRALIASGEEVLWLHPHGCAQALVSETVDVALVSVLEALLQSGRHLIIPGIGLASWSRYPYARLELRQGLGKIERVGFDPRDRLEVLLARLLLRENYLASPAFVPLEARQLEQEGAALDPSLPDGRLLTGPLAAGLDDTSPNVLDLGREWFELTLRPMVWGLFAARPSALSQEEALSLQGLVQESSPGFRSGAEPQEDHVPVRTRLDEFALLGLAELVDHLFYTGALDEIPDLNFFPASSDDIEPDVAGPEA